MQNTRFLIDESIRSVREISHKVSPHVLSDFGLAQGVRNFISKIAPLNVVNMAFNTNLDNERFDNDTEVVIYRVICELINNSLKHSGCSEIEVSLMLHGTVLTLHYHDNGCGYDADSVTLSGMGLSNITSRIDSLNGDIAISSVRGSGMSAVAHIDTAPSERGIKKHKRRWRKR